MTCYPPLVTIYVTYDALGTDSEGFQPRIWSVLMPLFVDALVYVYANNRVSKLIRSVRYTQRRGKRLRWAEGLHKPPLVSSTLTPATFRFLSC